MKANENRFSWAALALFYVVLILIITILDSLNNVLTLTYWGMQAILITIGVGLLALIGIFLPDVTAIRGILLAFTIGILTIIPAVLMGLGRIPGLWPQYFYIAFGMAAGSFLTAFFVRYSRKVVKEEQPELEREHFD
jgi:hypothetical protein